MNPNPNFVLTTDQEDLLTNIRAIDQCKGIPNKTDIKFYLNLSRGVVPALADDSLINSLIKAPEFAEIVLSRIITFFSTHPGEITNNEIKAFIERTITTAQEEKRKKDSGIETFQPSEENKEEPEPNSHSFHDKPTEDSKNLDMKDDHESQQKNPAPPTSNDTGSTTASTGASTTENPKPLIGNKDGLADISLIRFNNAVTQLRKTCGLENDSEDKENNSNINNNPLAETKIALKNLGQKVLADIMKSKNLDHNDHLTLAKILELTNTGIHKTMFTPAEATEYETLAKKIMTISFAKGLFYAMLAILGVMAMSIAITATLASFGFSLTPIGIAGLKAVGLVTIPTDIVANVATIAASLLAITATFFSADAACDSYSTATAPMAFYKAVKPADGVKPLEADASSSFSPL